MSYILKNKWPSEKEYLGRGNAARSRLRDILSQSYGDRANAQLKRIIQKIKVDKDGNMDIYLNLLGDLGLNKTILIHHDKIYYYFASINSTGSILFAFLYFNPAFSLTSFKLLIYTIRKPKSILHNLTLLYKYYYTFYAVFT